MLYTHERASVKSRGKSNGAIYKSDEMYTGIVKAREEEREKKVIAELYSKEKSMKNKPSKMYISLSLSCS